MLNKIIQKFIIFLKKKMGYQHRKWCLAFLSKKNHSILKVIYPPKGEFWADPFVFSYKNKDYVFFERFFFDQAKGQIACAEIRNNNLFNIKTIFNKKYHLSFPYIFKYKNQIFFICETYEKKQLEIFICKKFPTKWMLYSTGLKNIISADPVIIYFKRKLWLFVNQANSNLSDLNKYLYIYQIKNLKKFVLINHSNNPIIKNYDGGRNASGTYSFKNCIIRLSQINKTSYGEGLNVSKISQLNLKSYKEKKLVTIKASQLGDKNIVGIHSINNYKKTYLVDLCYEFLKET